MKYYFRTLKYLAEHLNKISQHSEHTGMTDKNLAIVWAPNLLRSPALESGGVAALRGVGVQAVVTEYLIKNCMQIFDALEDLHNTAAVRSNYNNLNNIGHVQQQQNAHDLSRLDSLTDCESLLVEQREHDQQLLSSSSITIERPKSLSSGGPKLISLEEAQERKSKMENTFDMKQSMPINMISSQIVNSGQNIGSYIEVGGGPSSLPDKYHTVLSVPRSWQKRKTHSWKSLFSRSTPVSNIQRPTTSGSDLKPTIEKISISSKKNFTKLSSHGMSDDGIDCGEEEDYEVEVNDDDDGIMAETPTNKDDTNRQHSTFSEKREISNNELNANKRGVKMPGGLKMSTFMKQQQQPQHYDEKQRKSELYESTRPYCNEQNKSFDMTARSNSIDSLRTVGHSRSVSHDSYFDLLQSPQRGHTATCPSR